MSKRLPLLLAAVAVLAMLATIALRWQRAAPADGPALQVVTRFPQPRVLPDFNLRQSDGTALVPGELKGHPFLLFFGFTHCPDICPTTLFEVSEIFRKLGPRASGMRALFVTVDPERDTPDKLKDYLSSFDPRLMAATGDEAAIKAVEKAYRVYAKKVPLDGGGYTMDHTAIVYLMDKDGRFVAPFNIKRRPEESAADLRRYL